MLKRLSVFILMAAVVLLAGCGKRAEEKAAEKALEEAIEAKTGGKVEADISKEKIQIKSEEGEMTIAEKGGAEIPEGFPADVPIYKDAKVLMSLKEKNSFVLSLESKDDVKQVVESYKSKMKAQNWDEKTVLNLGEGVMLQYVKDNRSVSITISKADEKTQISLTVSSEER